MTKAVSAHTRSVSVGQRFNRLTAIEFVARETRGSRSKFLWRFRCDCGNEVITRTESVRSGNTKSCGCLRVETCEENGHANATHGQSDTRIYRIWGAMHRRCENPENFRFEYYGGRGISVCEEWSSLERFRDWALANGYEDHLTIDRFPDKDGNYEPNNCRWATWSEQQFNRRPKRADRRYYKKPPPVT